MKKIKLIAFSLLVSTLLLGGCGKKNDGPVDPTFTVTYNKNGATSGEVPVDSKVYKKDEVATVMANESLVNPDHEFVNWNTASDGSGTDYDAGDTFTVTANTTLYAQWDGLWYMDAKEVLKANGADAPVESIGRWLTKDEATVDYEVIEDEGEQIVTINAVAYGEEEKVITSVFEEDLLNELFESKNWAILEIDDSGFDFGYLAGSLYAKPNSETNKYVIMEFMYVKEDSLASIILGQDPCLMFYLYTAQGYNAEDATNLLATGVFEIGGEKDLIVNGTDLSEISDTFIVDAEVSNPAEDAINNMKTTYDVEGVQSMIEDGNLVVYYPSEDSEAKSNAEILLNMVGFTINGTWADVSEEIQTTGFMAPFVSGEDYEATVIIAKDLFEYVAIIAITNVNPSLYKILSYDISCFSYDMNEVPYDKFVSMINTTNYTVNTNYKDSFGVFAFSNETLESGKCIEVNAYDDEVGNFVISVYPYDKAMTTYPIDSIKSMFHGEFETEIPVFGMDLAWVNDMSQAENSPFVGIEALDPVVEPSETDPSLLALANAKMELVATKWESEVFEDEGYVYYAYTSVEENDAGEVMKVILTEVDNVLIVQYAVGTAPKSWTDIAPVIAEFIENEGFVSTVLPMGLDEKIWNTYLTDDGYEYSLTISGSDPSGMVYALFASDLARDESTWRVDVGEDYVTAKSVEINEAGQYVSLDVSSSEGVTTIYVTFAYEPAPIPVDDINKVLESYGFMNMLDDHMKEFLMDPGEFIFEEGAEFIYIFIVNSENPYEYLVNYYTEMGLEVDDSEADWGYIYFSVDVGDYNLWIMVSDWYDGETAELSFAITYIGE